MISMNKRNKTDQPKHKKNQTHSYHAIASTHFTWRVENHKTNGEEKIWSGEQIYK